MWHPVRSHFFPAAIGAVLVLSSAAPLRAAGGIVEYLQGHPVSRWDFGLVRLEAELQTTQWPDLPQLSHSVVTVRGSGAVAGAKRATGILISYEMRESFDSDLCARAINAIRDYGGVENGKLKPAYRRAGNGSYFAGFFSPARNESRDGGYGERVDPVISIEIRMMWGRCSGPLLSKAIAFVSD